MRTVLWDMDGTIADTEQLHFQAWQMTMHRYGVSYSYADFIADFGRRNAELLPELLGVEPGADVVQRASREKEANFRRLAREQGLQAMPGVIVWLERFQAEGIQQVVSSSGPMANIVASVDILDISDFFLALMSGATLPKGKPDPMLFLNSAVAVGAEPRECLVVEDSIHGVEGARRAGMSSIAVGKVVGSAELNRLFNCAAGPGILAVDTLEHLSWPRCEDLWRQNGN
jgi:beta-phosphoglucomutase